MTNVFVEQPLALPGSAKKKDIVSTKNLSHNDSVNMSHKIINR